MKKFLSAVFLSAVFFGGALFCQTRGSRTSAFGFLYGAAGTGGAFYGSKEVNDRNTALNEDDFSRIVLALSGGAALILARPLYATLAVDSILDFHSGGTKYVNYLDFSAALGIRAYPAYASALAGFFVSVEYCTGVRNDVIRLEKEEYTSSTAWGNGFRFGAAYDFSHLTRGIAPVVGAAWKHIPRGNETNDDYITVYVSLGFKI
ncbi:MAG: hypothetical protein Pg6C_08490 [Treponemataceae bacterium]|nr:MAG: hypothetical protein Pg6C_08490 [Treponemataceae bacterium]